MLDNSIKKIMKSFAGKKMKIMYPYPYKTGLRIEQIAHSQYIDTKEHTLGIHNEEHNLSIRVLTF